MPKRIFVVKSDTYEPDWRPPEGCRLRDWDGWTGILLEFQAGAAQPVAQRFLSEHKTYATAKLEVGANR